MNTKLKKNKKGNKKEKNYEELKESKELIEPKNECFICLEIYYNNENTIKLNESLYYSKICDCNVWVHNVCLNKWYSTSCYSCPICRKYIFTDMYQYHYPADEIPVDQIPVNQNNKLITNFDKIIILLLLLTYLYLYKKKQQKETGLAY
jgi:hypothetical protein